ncbi:MAG: PadR family transcriptional regulator [Bacilli bacterium]|nr:PadR family transcriptional regulator [Bacilli bacterium]
MNTQFKKGVLELIVLTSINQKDVYGYELILQVSKVVDINEGTIYPLLKRLTNEKYAETYLVESTEGPPRKYYKITTLGKKRMKELNNNWFKFTDSVNKYIKECQNNE